MFRKCISRPSTRFLKSSKTPFLADFMLKKKILKRSALNRMCQRWRRERRKVVFTNGTFDILHRGHVSYLEKARAAGDILVVGLNSDRSVRSYKGPGRPLNPQADRAFVLAALDCVDFVVIFDEPTPLKLICRVRPAVLVKGADWKLKDIAGAMEV